MNGFKKSISLDVQFDDVPTDLDVHTVAGASSIREFGSSCADASHPQSCTGPGGDLGGGGGGGCGDGTTEEPQDELLECQT